MENDLGMCQVSGLRVLFDVGTLRRNVVMHPTLSGLGNGSDRIARPETIHEPLLDNTEARSGAITTKKRTADYALILPALTRICTVIPPHPPQQRQTVPKIQGAMYVFRPSLRWS